MPLSGLTRAITVCAREIGHDSTTSSRRLYSTTISGNQFATLRPSSEAETVYLVGLRSLLVGSRQSGLCASLFIHCIIRPFSFAIVFPMERDWSKSNHRNRFVTSADHNFAMNLVNLAIFSRLSSIKYYYISKVILSFCRFRWISWISIISRTVR